MRKLIGLILFLVLLGYPLVPVYGAELTVTNQEVQSCGNFYCVMGTIVEGNTGDSIAIRLRRVLFFTMVPTNTASTATPPVDQTDWGYHASGGTVTIYPETDGITWRFYATGTP